MFINELKLMQRKKLADYEHREVTVTVSMADGDKTVEAIDFIRSTLDSILHKTPLKKAARVAKVEVEDTTEVEMACSKKETKAKKTKTKKAAKKDPVSEDEPPATLDQAREAAKMFKQATGSSEKTKALIIEVTGLDKLKDVEDASLFTKFVAEVNERL